MQSHISKNTLTLRPVRELHLQSPTIEGGPNFLSAASGLAKVEDQYHVVADDALQMGSFPVEGQEAGQLRDLFAKRPALPADEKARKAVKPDLEALTTVETPNGKALLAVGSGSTDKRNSGVFIPLDDNGTPGQPVEFDLSNLYGALRQDFPELNIEGVAPVGDKLRLLQRGNGTSGPNAVIDIDLAQAVEAAGNGAGVNADLLENIKPADLGTTPGHNGPVPWTFTDLTPLADGRSVFTAAAEDTDNPYDDGEVLGSAVGILEADGTVSQIQQVDQKVKLEGVSAEPTASGAVATLVTDADDPHRPAMMYEVDLPL